MDFTLSPEIADYRQRIAAFVDEHVLPIEYSSTTLDAHEMIAVEPLQHLRALAKNSGLWAIQMPAERGGQGLSTVAWWISMCTIGQTNKPLSKWRETERCKRSGKRCSAPSYDGWRELPTRRVLVVSVRVTRGVAL